MILRGQPRTVSTLEIIQITVNTGFDLVNSLNSLSLFSKTRDNTIKLLPIILASLHHRRMAVTIIDFSAEAAKIQPVRKRAP